MRFAARPGSLFQDGSQAFEAGHVVDRQKVIDEGQHRLDALGEGLITRRTQEGVEPDQAAATELEAADLPVAVAANRPDPSRR